MLSTKVGRRVLLFSTGHVARSCPQAAAVAASSGEGRGKGDAMTAVSPRPTTQPPALFASDRGRPVGGAEIEGASFVPVRRGFLAAIPDDLEPHARERALHVAACAAVSRSTRSAHAISRLSAAVLHRLYVWRAPERPAVVGPDRREQGRHLDHDRQVAPIEGDVVVFDGLPVTSLERTAFDCARFEHPRDALVVVDNVLAVLSAADRRAPERTLRVAEQVRHRLLERVRALPVGARGRRRAQAVIEWATPWAESPWESYLRWVLLCWGRRDLVVQCRVMTSEGRCFTDIAIPDGVRPDGTTRYLHIEFDGSIKYAGGLATAPARVVMAERRRERAIEAGGDTVVRFVASEAADPCRVLATIQRELRTTGPRLVPVRELDVQGPRRGR